jgi:tetratricopeptide (TPR) repeat protein
MSLGGKMGTVEARSILELARQVEAHIFDEDGPAWVARLDERASDIGQALDAFVAADDESAALQLAGALRVFWQDSGRVEEGRLLTESLLDGLNEPQPTIELARACLTLGELAFRQGDQATATSATVRARRVGEELEQPGIIGRSELNLARVAFRDGDAPRMRAHAERVRTLAGDDGRLHAGATHMLGWAEYTAGNVEAAIAHFEENAAHYNSIGDRIGEASELANLADLAIESKDLSRGRTYLRRAFDIEGVEESRYLAPSLVRSVGVLAELEGRHEAGLQLIASSEKVYEEFGLIPDPGDDITARARSAAVGALDRHDDIEARARELTFAEAVTLARKTVAE